MSEKRPNMKHPSSDDALSFEEHAYAKEMVRAILAMHNRAEQLTEDHFSGLRVPLEICRRVIIHAAKHRTAMVASHHIAISGCDDKAAEVAAAEIANELRELILKQLPNSRDSLVEAKARHRHE